MNGLDRERSEEREKTGGGSALGYLASCGGDKLLNFWSLNGFSSFNGSLETVSHMIRSEGAKKKSVLDTHSLKGKTKLLPWKQTPTDELLTALLYVHPSAGSISLGGLVDRAEKKKKLKEEKNHTVEEGEEGYLFAGGEEGVVHVWSLRSLRIIQVRQLHAAVACMSDELSVQTCSQPSAGEELGRGKERNVKGRAKCCGAVFIMAGILMLCLHPLLGS